MSSKKKAIYCLRFKGIVRLHCRAMVKDFADKIDNKQKDPFLSMFFKENPISCIELFNCYDVPIKQWKEDAWKNHYDPVTGQWVLQTMMYVDSNLWKNIECELLPYLMDYIEVMEIWKEDYTFSQNFIRKQVLYQDVVWLDEVDKNGVSSSVDRKQETEYFKAG